MLLAASGMDMCRSSRAANVSTPVVTVSVDGAPCSAIEEARVATSNLRASHDAAPRYLTNAGVVKTLLPDRPTDHRDPDSSVRKSVLPPHIVYGSIVLII